MIASFFPSLEVNGVEYLLISAKLKRLRSQGLLVREGQPV
jgi:hypothetical protein